MTLDTLPTKQGVAYETFFFFFLPRFKGRLIHSNSFKTEWRDTTLAHHRGNLNHQQVTPLHYGSALRHSSTAAPHAPASTGASTSPSPHGKSFTPNPQRLFSLTRACSPRPAAQLALLPCSATLTWHTSSPRDSPQLSAFALKSSCVTG